MGTTSGGNEGYVEEKIQTKGVIGVSPLPLYIWDEITLWKY